MSDVVMRTRQLRRRTKDKAPSVGQVASVEDEDGDGEGGSGVPALRLAVGEEPQQSERRARHNSPLAKSRVTGIGSR